MRLGSPVYGGLSSAGRDTVKGCASPIKHLPVAAKIAGARHPSFAGRFCRQPASGRIPLDRKSARIELADPCASCSRMGHGGDGPLPQAHMEPLPRRCPAPALRRPHDPGRHRSSAGRSVKSRSKNAPIETCAVQASSIAHVLACSMGTVQVLPAIPAAKARRAG